MSKLIGYARVSTRQQSADRQDADFLAAGVRRDDLYVDHGVSGARASTPLVSMLFTIMAALAQMEHEIKRERIVG